MEGSLSLEYLSSDLNAYQRAKEIMDSIARMVTHHWESNSELTFALISKASVLGLIPKLKFEHLKPPVENKEFTQQWFDSWAPALNAIPLIKLLNYLTDTLNELHSKQDVNL